LHLGMGTRLFANTDDLIGARALQSAQLELERQLAADNLKKGLAQRPERGELVERSLFLPPPYLISAYFEHILSNNTDCFSVTSKTRLQHNS